MKKNLRLGSLLLLLAVILIVFSFLPVLAGKPQPPPPAPVVEPTGNLVMTSAPQLLARIGGYARVYDWVNSKFNNTWSGVTGDNSNVREGAIGDVDNDGQKEVVSWNTVATTSKGKTTFTRNLKIWNNGDASGSPSITKAMSGSAQFMEIGDVDNDGNNELVLAVLSNDIEIWSCTASDCTKEATIYDVGDGGLTIADADNDGYNELLIGLGEFGVKDYYCHGVVVKYLNGTYSVVGDLGPANTQCCIDDISVGNLDGVAGNEIFGSGYCGGNIYVWKYANDAYSQVWTAQRAACFDQNNEIADVNGDGSNEFAFSEMCNDGSNKLVVYSYAGNNIWTNLGGYSGSHGNLQDAMVSGDVDSDGKAEIVLQDQVWKWSGSAMSLIQNLTGTIYDAAMG
ncbi:MAG: VCBS repeat-containing protein [archaeon]